MCWTWAAAALVIGWLLSYSYILAFKTSAGFAQSDRVLVVTAHPDDECMFFTPVISSLKRAKTEVYLLCLSTGNAYGEGDIRAKELFRSCGVLQVPRTHVHVLDIPDLQDGFQNHWSEQTIAHQVQAVVELHRVTKVITFDQAGVSGHPNHVSTYLGVRALCKTRQDLGQCPQLYVLETTSLNRKFAGLLDVLVSMTTHRAGAGVFVSPAPWKAAHALMQHQTQLVWYRYLFILFSSYSYVNTLQRLVLDK